MKILLAYFSWTGHTEKVAGEIHRLLQGSHQVEVCRIQPVKERGYGRWLALSFLRGSRVRIAPAVTELSPYDLLILGSPKWTVSCPPLNQYIRLLTGHAGKRLIYFMTFGGFGQERFREMMVRKLRKRGLHVEGTLLVKRQHVQEGVFPKQVEEFFRHLPLS